MKKATPWHYPHHKRYDLRNYEAIGRDAAAAMLRDHKARGALYWRTDSYGRRWYMLTAERQIIAEFCIGRPQKEST